MSKEKYMITKFLKKIFMFFWKETTIKINERIVFEAGGFTTSLGITFFLLWIFGLLN